MDPFLCTHIIYSFGWMRKNKLVAHDLEADETRNGKKGGFEKIVDLKKVNPKLKVRLHWPICESRKTILLLLISCDFKDRM